MAKVPHRKTTTLIAALDHAGMRCSATIDGSVNQNAFEAFIEVLLPVLGQGTGGDGQSLQPQGRADQNSD